MSFLPTGTVYGTLLNFRRERDALGDRMSAPPHDAPPNAPVLYIKPANTWTPHGRAIALPADAREVWVGATIGMVIGPQPLVAGAPGAIEHVAGYVLMNDLSLPQPNLFRPPVRFNCIDGFLGIGAEPLPAGDAVDPSAFTLELRIDDRLVQTVGFADLVRPAAQLLSDVSEFMTLRAGDVLMLGCDALEGEGGRATRPLARAGQRIELSAPGFATLSNTLAATQQHADLVRGQQQAD